MTTTHYWQNKQNYYLHLVWRESIFLFWILLLSPASMAANTLATFVSLTVVSSFWYQPLWTSFVWPSWLVIQVNSTSFKSKSWSTVAKNFRVRVNLRSWAFLSSFSSSTLALTHPLRRALPTLDASMYLLSLDMHSNGTNVFIWEPER